MTKKHAANVTHIGRISHIEGRKRNKRLIHAVCQRAEALEKQLTMTFDVRERVEIICDALYTEATRAEGRVRNRLRH